LLEYLPRVVIHGQHLPDARLPGNERWAGAVSLSIVKNRPHMHENGWTERENLKRVIRDALMLQQENPRACEQFGKGLYYKGAPPAEKQSDLRQARAAGYRP
jgi:hypothetical protein